ncbi:LysE family translocator [Nocardiopsis baichengensis]|uniref:LysE family translocator n=1 Tax=Nocardiopsis baichengensis TaxID=280240 RepID=UPI000A02320C
MLVAVYRQGLISNLGNAKVAVFFTSLLPQFATGFWGMLALGVVFAAFTFCWLAAYSVAIGSLGRFLRRSVVHRVLDAATGAVLGALAVRLAVTDRPPSGVAPSPTHPPPLVLKADWDRRWSRCWGPGRCSSGAGAGWAVLRGSWGARVRGCARAGTGAGTSRWNRTNPAAGPGCGGAGSPHVRRPVPRCAEPGTMPRGRADRWC